MTQSTTKTSAALSIPTAARGAVRAFIKGQPGFDKWVAKMGINSRDVRNVHLIEYAEGHGLIDKVQQIIVAAAGNAAAMTVVRDKVRAGVEAFIDNAKEDAVIEAQIDSEMVKQADAGFDIDTVLANVDQLLSPLVRKEIENALRPVIEAANKPAVEVEAAPVAPVGQRPYAVRTGRKAKFCDVFGIVTSERFGETQLSFWDAHGAAPAVDPFYVVDALNMAILATAAEHETNVWLVGPSGSGKTTMPEQFCARVGRPFVKIGFTRQTEVSDLVGGQGLRAGETSWEEGALIQAMKRPGTCILLDEITFAQPGVQAIIQGAADGHRTYTVHATGEIVRCAPGVFFVVADNTNGAGDESGQYAGTNQANAALINRFPRMVKVDYLTVAQEADALVNHTRIPLPAAAHVVGFAAQVRKLPEMEGVAFSLRNMVGFVRMAQDGFPVGVAFDAAILTRLPATERAAVETMATLQWQAEFEALLEGKPLPQPQPEFDTLAAKAFADDDDYEPTCS